MSARSILTLCTLTVALAYANALDLGFHFDDAHVIETNPAIRSLANLPRFFLDPDTSTSLPSNRNARPLLIASFALNYAMSGLEPWSYHLTNILLHWLATILVFRIVRDHLGLGRQATTIAGVAALIMASHPLNTSAVNYVSARSAVMATVGYLAAFDAAARSRWGLSLMCAALGLLTKEIVLTLPIVVWLHARSFGRPVPVRYLGALVVLCGGAAAYHWMLLPASALAAIHDPSVAHGTYFLTGLSSYLYYARAFLLPTHLVVDRLDYPIARSMFDVRAWGSALVLIGFALLSLRIPFRGRAWRFAAAWVGVTLAIETLLLPLSEPVNEHRPYLAMLGFCTMAAIAIVGVASACVHGWHRQQRVIASVAAVATLVLGVGTHVRNRVWASDYLLWVDATRKAPNNTRAWSNAGYAALSLGRLDEARRLLLESERRTPCYVYALINLSALERREAAFERAREWAETAVRCRPDFALSHHYLGAAWDALGKTDAALAAYRTAIERDPRYVDAWERVAQLEEARGAWAVAAESYARAAEIDPTRVSFRVSAGVLYRTRLQRPDLAVAALRDVLSRVPEHYGARYQLAVALLAAGDEAAAIEAWRRFVPLAVQARDDATLAAAPQRLTTAVAGGPQISSPR